MAVSPEERTVLALERIATALERIADGSIREAHADFASTFAEVARFMEAAGSGDVAEVFRSAARRHAERTQTAPAE